MSPDMNTVNTDERHDDEIHGLLATAFDDEVPVVDLVPAAVDGFHRHRRRTRALGTAGGALALAGVVAAATVLMGGSGSTARVASAASGSSTDTLSRSTGTAANCAGPYYTHPFDDPKPYSVDQRGWAELCDQDLAALRKLSGDDHLAPGIALAPDVLDKKSAPPVGSGPTYIAPKTRLTDPGVYEGRIGNVPYRFVISVSDKLPPDHSACTPQSCPSNRTLADGHRATEQSGGKISYLIIPYDATHVVDFIEFLPDRSAADTVPVDFEKLIASPGFAKLISEHVQKLDQLRHPA